jgi:hypothetical protein
MSSFLILFQENIKKKRLLFTGGAFFFALLKMMEMTIGHSSINSDICLGFFVFVQSSIIILFDLIAFYTMPFHLGA